MSLIWTIAWGIVLGFIILFVIWLIIVLLAWLLFGNSIADVTRNTANTFMPGGSITFNSGPGYSGSFQ